MLRYRQLLAPGNLTAYMDFYVKHDVQQIVSSYVCDLITSYFIRITPCPPLRRNMVTYFVISKQIFTSSLTRDGSLLTRIFPVN